MLNLPEVVVYCSIGWRHIFGQPVVAVPLFSLDDASLGSQVISRRVSCWNINNIIFSDEDIPATSTEKLENCNGLVLTVLPDRWIGEACFSACCPGLIYSMYELELQLYKPYRVSMPWLAIEIWRYLHKPSTPRWRDHLLAINHANLSCAPSYKTFRLGSAHPLEFAFPLLQFQEWAAFLLFFFFLIRKRSFCWHTRFGCSGP